MALDINGYNPVFNSFIRFAQERANANDAKAVATARTNKIGNHTFLAIKHSETDEVHKWLRTNEEYGVNDRTRDLFKRAIINMFGGESKIPASVKKAMLLGDYNAGKPLTARRILAVKAAIDADGTAKARSEKIRLETFSAEAKEAVLGMGYTKAELPKLARATHFYAQAMGVSEMDAMREICEPGTKANRLMSYGGRFLQSAENFADGLRLMDQFATWHADLCETTAAIARTGNLRKLPDYSAADTPSKLNASQAAMKPGARNTMEKFVFEEIAHNPSANLKETDGEAIFGFRNNLASRFIGQNFGHSCLNTVGNIPPAKRPLVFKALNLFCAMAESPADHQKPPRQRILVGGDRTMTLARILRHLDEVAALEAKGKLTAKNVIKICFPDMVAAKATGNWDVKAVNKFFDDTDAELRILPEDGGEYFDIAGPIGQLMESAGCTLQEAATSLRGGKPIPPAPYVSAGQLGIEDFETVQGGRDRLAGDLDRPENYSFGVDAPGLLGPDAGFGFIFPGENRFVTNHSAEGRANITRVGDKVEAMCGRVHPKQASAVMMMLSQSGIAGLRGGLRPHGVFSSEHSAVDFTLSKDAATGAVTIKYTSPEELPFRFEWTATVDVDGKVTTTPMKFEKPVENLDIPTAKKTLSAAAKKLGVNLDKASLNAGAALLAQHGTGMYAKNLAYLASYIAKSPLTGTKAAAAATRIANLATSIRGWRDFSFEDAHKMRELAQAVARHHNEYIEECFADETKFHLEKGVRTTFFETFFQDAPRNTYIINGKVFKKGSDVPSAQRQKDVGDTIKAAVPEAKAQKALTVLMNQSGPGDILQFTNHLPIVGRNGPELPHELPGANRFVNRDMMSNLYPTLLFDSSMTFDLEVAKDGRSAVVTITLDAQLEAGDGVKNADVDTTFGTAQIQERITLDLTPETPVVTDVAFAQRLV